MSATPSDRAMELAGQTINSLKAVAGTRLELVPAVARLYDTARREALEEALAVAAGPGGNQACLDGIRALAEPGPQGETAPCKTCGGSNEVPTGFLQSSLEPEMQSCPACQPAKEPDDE